MAVSVQSICLLLWTYLWVMGLVSGNKTVVYDESARCTLGEVTCLYIEGYTDYQEYTCVTKDPIFRNLELELGLCIDPLSTTCWNPCMLEKHEKPIGDVSNDCRCKGMKAWQVALIVISCLLFCCALVGIRFFVYRRLSKNRDAEDNVDLVDNTTNNVT